MKPRKKNDFLTLVFSFIPGAAEMYMGFMKSGFSILMAFATPYILMGMLYGADYIVLLSGVVYCIGFFHARHLATAPDEEFNEYKDKYIWEEYISSSGSSELSPVYRKWTAVALLFVGGIGVWTLIKDYIIKIFYFLPEQNLEILQSIMNSVPRLVFSILVIYGGIVLIKGKKKELIKGDSSESMDK